MSRQPSQAVPVWKPRKGVVAEPCRNEIRDLIKLLARQAAAEYVNGSAPEPK